MLMNDQVCLKYLHEHHKIIMISYQSIVITFWFVWVLNPATQLAIFVWLLLLLFIGSSRKFAFALKLFLFDLSNVVLNNFTVMLFLANRGKTSNTNVAFLSAVQLARIVFCGNPTCLKK